MKKKLCILTLVSALLLSPLGLSSPNKTSIAATSFQRVNYISAKVNASALNVRQGPSTRFPIVCVLKSGQIVKVLGKIDGWSAVYEPGKRCIGLCMSQYLKPIYTAAPSSKPIPTPVPKPVNTPTPVKTPTPINTPAPTSPQSTAGVTSEEQTLLNLINSERSKAGIAPLSFDMAALKVARLKAKDMVDNNYFAHQSPTYGSPFDMMRQFGVSFKTAGENIAGNQTLEGAVKAWMNSEGHRKNILNGNFNYTGIGIVSSPVYGKVLVQNFIGR